MAITPSLPVSRDTRDSILGIKGKLKVVLSHLEFYLIHAACRIRRNSLRIDPTGKLIKSCLNSLSRSLFPFFLSLFSSFPLDSYCKEARLFLAVNNDRVKEHKLPLSA